MLCTAPCGRVEVLLAWPLDRSFVVLWRCGRVAVQMWAVLWAHGQVLSAIAEPAMFWLDAHYEGGNLGEYDLQCPLMRELRLILTHTYCRHPTTHPPSPSPSTAPLPAPSRPGPSPGATTHPPKRHRYHYRIMGKRTHDAARTFARVHTFPANASAHDNSALDLSRATIFAGTHFASRVNSNSLCASQSVLR